MFIISNSAQKIVRNIFFIGVGTSRCRWVERCVEGFRTVGADDKTGRPPPTQPLTFTSPPPHITHHFTFNHFIIMFSSQREQERASTFKKTISTEDARRKREQASISIRKDKREESLMKRRKSPEEVQSTAGSAPSPLQNVRCNGPIL
jgi:hypothetical protein